MQKKKRRQNNQIFGGFKPDTTGKLKDLTAISASIWYAKDYNNKGERCSALNRHFTLSLRSPACMDEVDCGRKICTRNAAHHIFLTTSKCTPNSSTACRLAPLTFTLCSTPQVVCRHFFVGSFLITVVCI